MKKFLLATIARYCLITVLSICLGLFAFPAAGIAQCLPFTNTTAGLGFTQELVASLPTSITTGYGFDSHGNVYTVDYNTGNLFKIDMSTTVPAPGGVGTVHPYTNLGRLTYRTGVKTGQTITGGYNFTQYPDGTVYFNSNIGVIQVDLETATVTSDPLSGSAWGIVVDPQLNSHGHHNIITAGGYVIDPVDHRNLGSCGISGDGIAIDATGNFLFAAGGLRVYKRVLAFNANDIPVFTLINNYGGNPDGMAFGVVGTDQVVVSNDGGNGTVTMWKFPNNDFTKPPTPTIIASGPAGGEYGDQANVGPDGYFYITYWYHTRFPDCSINNTAAIVRFGPAGRFLPPTHSDNISLTPATDTKNIGTSVVLTATQVTTDLSTNQTVPVANTSVTFTVVGGPDLGQTFTGTTDVNGIVTFTLVNQNGIGADVVHAQFVDGNHNTQTSNNSVITFIKPLCTTPAFTSCPGNQTANTLSNSCDNTVTYSSTESVTGSPAPTITYAFTGATIGSGTGNGSGSVFNKGTTTVTLTATNSCGTATCTFTVTVTDNLPPVITTNGDQNASAEAGKCGASVSVSASATDNCSVGTPSGVRSDNLSLSDSYPVGTTTITWNVSDDNGNPAAPVTQTVTVKDNQIPVITASGSQSVNNDAGTCGALVTMTATAKDNCGVDAPVGTRSDGLALSAPYPVGSTTVTWNVTDKNGNPAIPVTQTVVVTDNEKPAIACAGNQIFCANTGGNLNYTIPALQQGDNCGIATTTYTVSGATTRSGSGTDASGVFNIGVSTVTYTVTDIHNNVSTCSFTVTINPLPVASITASVADDFCNKLTLTGNSTLSGPFGYQWSYSSSNFQSTKQISLGLTNGDGVYSLITTDVNGCKSEFAATYDYKKQNLSSSYTIIGYNEAELGSSSVATGSVGVTSTSGKAEFKKNGSVAGPGSFVKAKAIVKDGSNIVISNPIYTAATGIALPTMLYNTASTSGLSSVTVNQNATSTLTGNYKNVNIKKGANVTLSGTIFGTIRVDQGARVKFTAATINVEQLQVVKGPRVGYSYVQFSQNTNVLVSGSVSIGSQVSVNPDGYKVTFYVGKKTNGKEDDGGDNQFTVKGGDTRVTANVFMPKGEMHVTGGYSYGDYGNGKGDSDKEDDDEKCAGLGNSFVYMTGLFIAQDVETEGKNVIWNSYDCSTPPVVAVNSTTAVTQSAISENATPSTEEELKVTVMPNPSTNYFTLKLESRFETPVNIVVMDVSGRVIDAKSKIASNSTIQIGQNYISGKYYAEIIQGTTHKTVQLMKIK